MNTQMGRIYHPLGPETINENFPLFVREEASFFEARPKSQCELMRDTVRSR
jgi:hypothetical protein